MKRVVVTGGTGFVGANLVRRLLGDGHETHLLVRHDFQPWRIAEICDDVRLHAVDLGDRATLDAFISQIRPDWVFHLAAYGAYASQTDLPAMLRTNVVGTANLVEACLAHGFEAFVNTGSSSEYGYQDRPPTEEIRPEPNSHYAVTKLASTQFCRYTARARGVRLPTLRLYSVFGPYEEPTRLIPTLITQGLAGALPPLVDPDIARDYVYIDDVVEAYLLAARQPGGEPGAIYNVGTGVQTTLRQIVDLTRETLGITAEPVWGSMPNRRWDTTTWVSDSRLLRRELGWEPRVSLRNGFQATIDWLRSSPMRNVIYA